MQSTQLTKQLPKKLVITGGPSGGKTTLIEALKNEFGSKIKVAHEAASILYKGGFPRLKNYSGYMHGQLAIYATQKELEAMLCANYPKALIVCDRGSLDSLAYWPDTEAHFFETVHSNRSLELQRYDYVIHLDTAKESDYDISNPIRTENYIEAVSLNEKTKKAWIDHPRRQVIGSETDFLTKMSKARDLVAHILKEMDLLD